MQSFETVTAIEPAFSRILQEVDQPCAPGYPSSIMRTPNLHHVHRHHGPTGRGIVARVRMTA
jgi:hypothetical protein